MIILDEFKASMVWLYCLSIGGMFYIIILKTRV